MTDRADRIRRRNVAHGSSRAWAAAKIIEAHLARSDAVSPKLDAVVRALADAARAAARDADAAERGAAPARAAVPLHAPIVERMRAAGAIPTARSNLPEMGLGLSTDARG